MIRHDWESTTRRNVPALDAALVHAARALPTATLHEAGGKIGALPAAIKPITPGMAIAGRALTVHSPGADNLWLHRALDIAVPGDVLVVYTNGMHEHGYWGEIMTTMAKTRRLAGLVIDACVRDGVLLGQIGFPVFARGLAIRGTGKDFGATGWLNAPVRIGEVTVEAGDLVVGDGDGVVIVPRARAVDVIEASRQREAAEAAILKRLEAGEATLDVYGWR